MFPSTIKQCIIVSVPPFFICLVACLKHVATVSQTLVYLSRGMLKARRNRTHIISSANLQRRAKVKNKEHIVTTDTHTHTHRHHHHHRQHHHHHRHHYPGALPTLICPMCRHGPPLPTLICPMSRHGPFLFLPTPCSYPPRSWFGS